MAFPWWDYYSSRGCGGMYPKGMCKKCNEFRPCRCGEFCPSCLSDVRNLTGRIHECVDCGKILFFRDKNSLSREEEMKFAKTVMINLLQEVPPDTIITRQGEKQYTAKEMIIELEKDTQFGILYLFDFMRACRDFIARQVQK